MTEQLRVGMVIDFDELSELLKTLRGMGVKQTEYSIVSPWTRRLPPPGPTGL